LVTRPGSSSFQFQQEGKLELPHCIAKLELGNECKLELGNECKEVEDLSTALFERLE
jgi:hypothetical protein